MQHAQIIDAQGRVIDGNIVPPGGKLRIPINLMDAKPPAIADTGAGHRPGSLPLTDPDRAARVTRQALADKKLSERWKKPPETLQLTQVQQAGGTPPDRAALYQRHDAALAQRWRKGGAA